VGAGLPARRAGRLVEERPRRGAPLHQQQGEFVSAAGAGCAVVSVAMWI